MFKEYGDYDALGLAGLIRERKVSAPDVLEAALARAEAVNAKLNAIITPVRKKRSTGRSPACLSW